MQHFWLFSNEQRAEIVAHKDAAIALRRIASNMQRSYLTVQNILTINGNQSQKPCSGRIPLVSERVKRIRSYFQYHIIIGILFIIRIKNFKEFFLNLDQDNVYIFQVNIVNEGFYFTYLWSALITFI